MAEQRKNQKVSAYSLRKRTKTTEDKENYCQPVIKENTTENRPRICNCAQKNRNFVETTGQSDSKKFKFSDPSSFRVYLDSAKETGIRNKQKGKHVEEKTKSDKDRVGSGAGKKDKLSRPLKGSSRKDEQEISKGKGNRTTKISKPVIQSQSKDTKRLASNIPTVRITRRASSTESAEPQKILQVPLKKAASITTLASVSQQSNNLPTRSNSATKKTVKTSSTNVLTAVQNRLFPTIENYTAKLRSSRSRNSSSEVNQNKPLETVKKEVSSHRSRRLVVDQKKKSKSQEILSSADCDLRENKPLGSSTTKLAAITRRVRFRSADDGASKKAEAIAKSKSNSGNNAAEPLDSGQKYSNRKNKASTARVRSPQRKLKNDVFLEPCASSTAAEIITPEDCLPIPTPKTAKAERKECDPERKSSRQAKDTGFLPYETDHLTEYIADTVETEWKKHTISYKLSGNFLKKGINAEQRKIIVSFLLHVGYHCHFPSFILYQTVKLFDATVDTISLDIANFQLAALACLWISLKKEENIWKVPSAAAILSLAKDQYEGNVKLLLQCERQILSTLEFQITFSDPYTLSVYYLFHCKRYVPIDENLTSMIYYSSGYMFDLSLLDEKCCNVPAVLLAITVAELLFCLFIDSEDDLHRPRWLYWRSIIERNPKLPERFCCETIDILRARLIKNTLHSRQKHSCYKMVYKKYKLNRYGKISEILGRKIMKLPCEEYIPL